MPLQAMTHMEQAESGLQSGLDRIDRQTVMLVTCVPLFLAPVAIALGLGGWGGGDPAQARLILPTGLMVTVQGLLCMLLAAAGRLRLALAVAVVMSIAVVLHSSLWIGLGLRTPAFTALATICFLSAYLFGSRLANAIAFVSLGFSLIIAMMALINPELLTGNTNGGLAPVVQPTAMLLSHLGLFINTQIICAAYSRKKDLLLQHIDGQNAELEMALAKRKAALRDRQNLLGQIAHNLRTPLATVTSALQLMERTAGQPERQQRYAGNLRNAVAKIQWQTTQFSTYQQLHGGKVAIEPTPTSVERAIASVIDLYATLPQYRAVSLRTVIEPNVHAKLLLDPVHFCVMFRNLLDNALKYVQDGSVDVMVDETDSAQGASLLTVSVLDNGPGLAQDIIPALFEPFVQGQENPANSLEGSGLGLYITRGLACQMGGDAGIENRTTGGCRAWFTLPVKHHQNGMRHAA